MADTNRHRRDGDLRASDAQREATAGLLGRHHAEGRLDAEEFSERLERCYAAKKVGELDELVVDLPPDNPPAPAPDRAGFARRRMWPLPGLAAAIGLLVVVSALTGGPALWLLWPLALLSFGPFAWAWACRDSGRDAGDVTYRR